eukprot:gene8966-9925_t
MSFPANQETVKDKVKRVGLGAAKVKSLVSKFEGYIENKNNPCQVSDNEEEELEELDNESTKKKRIAMPLITSEEELIKKICLLTTKEEIERLHQQRSENAWSLFILGKESTVFDIERMEQEKKVRKAKLREEGKEQDIDEDDAKEEDDYVKKAAMAENWPLRTKISQILKFYGLPHGDQEVISNEYFDSKCDYKSFATMMFGADSQTTGACKSAPTSQNAKQVHRRRQRQTVKPANSNRDAAVDVDSQGHQSKVSMTQMANALNDVWAMLNTERNMREEMQKKMDSLQETILKERQEQLALEKLIDERNLTIKISKAGSEIEELKDEVKHEVATETDQKQQSNAKKVKEEYVDSPEDANERIETELDEDYQELIQMQKEQMEMFKQMMENKQQMQVATNQSVIKRLEHVEKQITSIGFQQHQQQEQPTEHEDKSVIEEQKIEIMELKNKLELANKCQEELQCTIQEKQQILQMCADQKKKDMEQLVGESVGVTELKAELEEAKKTMQQMQSMIDSQKDDIANHIAVAEVLALQVTQCKEEKQIMENKLREELSMRERAMKLFSEQFCDVEKENNRLKEQLDDVVDTLADTVSMNSIVKADGDLTIEGLDTMLKAKDQQIQELQNQLQKVQHELASGSNDVQDSLQDGAISDGSTNQSTTQGEGYGTNCGDVSDIKEREIVQQELTESPFVNEELRKIMDEGEEESSVMLKGISELRKLTKELVFELNEESSKRAANSARPWGRSSSETETGQQESHQIRSDTLETKDASDELNDANEEFKAVMFASEELRRIILDKDNENRSQARDVSVLKRRIEELENGQSHERRETMCNESCDKGNVDESTLQDVEQEFFDMKHLNVEAFVKAIIDKGIKIVKQEMEKQSGTKTESSDEEGENLAYFNTAKDQDCSNAQLAFEHCEENSQ